MDFNQQNEAGTAPVPPLRVVHVLTAMNRGGIETWLMQVLRNHDPAKVHYELLLLSEQVGAYDQELHDLGIAVQRCPPPQSGLNFIQCVFRTLKRGRYDVVHSHVHQFSGVVLALASLAGIRGRIAHSHLDTRPIDQSGRWTRRLYLRAMKALIARFATEGLAVGTEAAAALFGEHWARPQRRGPPLQVLPLGIDARPYEVPVDEQAVRRSLGIAPDALVLGHVGWFNPRKNHSFLLEVFTQVRRQRPDARLLLIGVGELMEQVRAEALERGVLEAVIFAGSRGDVPALLRSMDVFMFPSKQEGLGLAVIEAQMSGLPCVTASHLPTEAHMPGSNLTVLALNAGVSAWTEAVLSAAKSQRRRPSSNPFDLQASMRLYEESYARYRR